VDTNDTSLYSDRKSENIFIVEEVFIFIIPSYAKYRSFSNLILVLGENSSGGTPCPLNINIPGYDDLQALDSILLCVPLIVSFPSGSTSFTGFQAQYAYGLIDEYLSAIGSTLRKRPEMEGS